MKALIAESCSDDKYVQKSVMLEPMNGRQRWLMHEFVGSSSTDVKLCTLPGPGHAKPMEVRRSEAAAATHLGYYDCTDLFSGWLCTPPTLWEE